MADEKKKNLTDLYPNEAALLKRIHQYLIGGNSNQARTLIEDYYKAKRDKRARKDMKEDGKIDKQELSKEMAIRIVGAIDQKYDDDNKKNIEDLRKRSDSKTSIKEVKEYDRAMAKRKELKEKFNI